MNCREAQRAQAAGGAGEPGALPSPELEAHLAACATCGADAMAYRALAGVMREEMALRHREAAALDPELPMRRQRLLGGLPARTAAWPRGWAGSQAAALAVVLLGFGFTGGWWLRGARPAPASGAGAPAAQFQVERLESSAGQVAVRYAEVSPQTLRAPAADPAMEVLLLRAVEHPVNAGMRMDAIRLLRPAALPAGLAMQWQAALLEALRDDANPGVRLQALQALAPRAAEPAVMEALAESAVSDQNAGVRAAAIEGLGRAPGAAAVLRRIGNGTGDAAVRLSCAAALQELRAGVPTEWLQASWTAPAAGGSR